MPAIEFPYTRHKGYFMPIVPISINTHKLWVFVDSGATFSIMTTGEAARIGIDWQSGRRQMIVVGDSSYIHNLPATIGDREITVPIGFSERLGVGFNLLGRTGVFSQFEVCFNDQARKVTFQPIASSSN